MDHGTPPKTEGNERLEALEREIADLEERLAYAYAELATVKKLLAD